MFMWWFLALLKEGEKRRKKGVRNEKRAGRPIDLPADGEERPPPPT